MSFDEYLTSKKIDGKAFKQAEPKLFHEWEKEFLLMHVNSFTVQKLNLINPIRRKFPLKDNTKINEEKPVATAASIKPAAPRMVKPNITAKPQTDENV